MIEQKLEIPLADGAPEAFLYKPDNVGQFPGVVFLTDVWGIRPANQGVARRLAERGFAVLMPNAFFRYSHVMPEGFELADDAGKQKVIGALFQALTPQRMASDGPAYADFLLKRDGVCGARAGIVGYCFTGAMAVRTVAAAPDLIAAAASFHGGWLATDQPDSPHRLLPKIKARLYFGHAVQDQSMTAAQIATLEAALRAWHGAFQSETYEGARHGWTVPGRDVYDEPQAERAFEKLVELFDATLK
jgi:carboxymethylenebutenolidase